MTATPVNRIQAFIVVLTFAHKIATSALTKNQTAATDTNSMSSPATLMNLYLTVNNASN